MQRILLRRFAASQNPLISSVRPLNNPDPFRSNLGLTEKGSNNKAGGLRRLPLLLFGLGIWLIQRTANRQGASVENVGVNVAGVIEDETLGPVNVGFLSTVGIVLKADGTAYLVKQSLRSLGHDNSFGTLVFAQGAGLWYNTIRD